MVPNNVVLSVAVVPLREPAGVDLRARLRPDVTPVDVQALLEETVETPMRDEPRDRAGGDRRRRGRRAHRRLARAARPTARQLSSEVLRALAAETRRAEAA